MEQWKDIAGYEGLYQVSDMGNVRSKARYIKSPWKGRNAPSKPIKFEVKKGYNTVRLYKQDGISTGKTCSSVHRLVATAFIPNPDNKPCVNHINAIRTDNRIENLEWVTYQENSTHAVNMRLMKQAA
jgi:hypothetical protein